MIEDMFPRLDVYYKDPAQYLRTAGCDLDDPDRDLSDLSVPRVKLCLSILHSQPDDRSHGLLAGIYGNFRP